MMSAISWLKHVCMYHCHLNYFLFRDCGYDNTCVLCIHCFQKSIHKNHHYKVFMTHLLLMVYCMFVVPGIVVD